ncbi:biotin/lipoate--protein ligase family protein [Roseibium sp. M-1]
MSELQFPPLFRGEALSGGADPVERALALAITGSDPGIVVYNFGGGRLRAGIVFAPEVPLEEAMAILPVCGLGFQAALGTLAPPEVAVHLEWDGRIRVNGAVCGRMHVKAATTDPLVQPDWLVLGLELDMANSSSAPGRDPDRTWLSEEGCGEIGPEQLLECWTRHALYWINRWLDDGPRSVHADWRALVPSLGEHVEIDGRSGTFVGVDENFGMLLRDGNDTVLIPLSSRLER